MTTNEFVCFTDLGYKIGQFAPGLKLPAAQVNQVRHHADPGAWAGRAGDSREYAERNAGGSCGERLGVCAGDGDDEHIEAARKATRDENAPFLTR